MSKRRVRCAAVRVGWGRCEREAGHGGDHRAGDESAGGWFTTADGKKSEKLTRKEAAEVEALRARVAELERERNNAIEAYAVLLSRTATDGALDAAETRVHADAAEERVRRLEGALRGVMKWFALWPDDPVPPDCHERAKESLEDARAALADGKAVSYGS